MNTLGWFSEQFEKVSSLIETTILLMVVIAASLICLPFFLFGFFVFCIYYSVKFVGETTLWIVKTTCNSPSPIFCGLVGALFGYILTSLWPALIFFGLLGFMAGLALNIPYESTPQAQKGPFWQSDRSAIYQEAQKVTDKPWAWKGFEVEAGPREDDLRKDL